MPLPALTITNSVAPAVTSSCKIRRCSESRSKSIGSFRNIQDVKSLVPENLYRAIYDDIPDGLDVGSLITIDATQNKHYLNHAAFGHAYDSVLELSLNLRRFAEQNPDVFYDQACLPLINNTYKVLEEFFKTKQVVLVPNCTFGLRSILEHLTREKGHKTIATLQPIYGATEKLLESYRIQGDLDRVLNISPGHGKNRALLEEDPQVIVEALEDAYALQEFTVLFCDQVASQSGRVLPLEAVTRFCHDNHVVLVVDGTQSCQLFFGNQKAVLDKVDFFVMSTHKWWGNVKTCGLIRYKSLNSTPHPPAISFGWEPLKAGKTSVDMVKARFQWQGMLDSYISYICLARAVKIFAKYGEAQMMHSSATLERGIMEGLRLVPLMPRTYNPRVINIIEMNSSQLETLGECNRIQNVLQDYGIFVSIKKMGKSCNDCVNLNIDNCKESCCSRPENETCLKPRPQFYMRISCWSYVKQESFNALNQVLNNNLDVSCCTTQAIKHQFLFMQDLYERLFSVLKTRAFFIRAERLRHHLIFYFAHTAVFFINKLVVSGYLDITKRIDPKLESVMSVGVDEMSWDDLLEDNYEWTSMGPEEQLNYLEMIMQYRERVRQIVLSLLDSKPVSHPIQPNSLHWLILMGIEHEKIHLETSAVIISQVPVELIEKQHNFNFPTYYSQKAYKEVNCPADAPSNTLIRIPGGRVQLGRDHHDQNIYAWDNEFGSEKKDLKPFTASQMLVSNAEYLEFVEAGGYTEQGKEWWSEEGWRYVEDMKVAGPRFWVGTTHYRMLLEVIPMPWDFPVEVNNLEAEAFCRWKSAHIGKSLRLMSHEESVHMRNIATRQTVNANLNKFASPTPVNLHGGLIGGRRVYDISGNVWRHSVSVLTTMEGFKTDPFYNDFTLPTIDGFHNHILGGSWISLGNCYNVNARYGFRRHFYQYAGIRYVCSQNDYHDRVMKIFDEKSVGQQMSEHFTDFTDTTLLTKKPISNWPRQFGQLAAEMINQDGMAGKIKVLVAHGGVGRATLELLRNCQDIAIDHTDTSANSLQVLGHLLEHGRVQWYQQLEGNLMELLEYHLPGGETRDLLLTDPGNTVAYWQADYKNLRPQLDSYQVIVADFRYTNSAPELRHLTSKLIPGGLLLLGTIDDVTGPCLGPLHSLVVLERLYTPVKYDGALLETYAHIYKETRNKHQYSISHFSAWRRNDVENVEMTAKEKDLLVHYSTSTTEYYLDKSILTSYDQFHFGDGLLGVRNFPLRMAEVCVDFSHKYGRGMNSALDAGCGPGRTALELCARFKNVEAYDYSQGFVDMLIEKRDAMGLTNLKAYQGDSHDQSNLTDQRFDLIFGCNLIDRLHTPIEWIRQSKEMLNEGGLLVIASPYTWRPEYTPVDQWIGGFLKDAENHFTVEGLKAAILPELILLEELKVPFVIPDADGTFQYTYSNVTVFGAPRKA